MKGPLCIALSLGVLASALTAQGDTPAKPKRAKTAKEQKKLAKGLTIGRVVPKDLALPDMDGKLHKFGDYRGKVVFVHFWSIRCPWEKYAEPAILNMQKRFRGKEVAFLAINANRTEIGATPPEIDPEGGEKAYPQIRAHCDRVKFSHPVLIDHGNRAADLFQARTTPHCYVIDKKGVLQYAGALDDYNQHRDADLVEPYALQAIDAVLAGKEPKLRTTRPYG